MRRRTFGTTLALALLTWGLVLGVVGRGSGDSRGWSLSRAPVARDAGARLAQLGPTRATYYVSHTDERPAHLADLERDVVEALSALSRASATPGGESAPSFEFRVVHPERDAAAREWLSALGHRPGRVRRVVRDGWEENELWSLLALEREGHPTLCLPGVTFRERGILGEWVLGHLEALGDGETGRPGGRRPRIALAAPAGQGGFTYLEAELENHGTLQLLDLASAPDQASAQLLPDVDLLFWVRPGSAPPALLSALRRHLGLGRDLVVCGSAFEGEPAEPSDFDAGAVGALLGLSPSAGRVLEPLAGEPERRDRFLVPPTHHDFREFTSQPGASLAFESCTAWETDVRALELHGYEARPIVSSSVEALLEVEPHEGASAAPRARALALHLSPTTADRGNVVLFGSSLVVHDSQLARSDRGHQALVRLLLDTLASPAACVDHDALARRPARIEVAGTSSRAALRVAVVLPIPMLLCVWHLVRRTRRRRPGQRSRRASRVLIGATTCVALLLAAGALARGVRQLSPGLDLSTTARHRLPERARSALAGLDEPLTLELDFPTTGATPPAWRPGRVELERLARSLARASRGGARVDVVRRTLDADEALAAGLPVVTLRSELDESTRVRRVCGAVRLLRARPQDDDAGAGEQVLETLAFTSPEHFALAELRLILALERAGGAPRPRVGLAAHPARLSPAEQLTEYQREGLFAPTEEGAYSEARAALERLDVELIPIDTAQGRPVDEEPLDVIVWLGPQREARPMLDCVSRHLAAGRPAVIALQHFDVDLKRFDRAPPAWWPRPRFPDVDGLYLASLGLELVREVLFDERSIALGLGGHGSEAPPSPFHLEGQTGGSETESAWTRGLAPIALPCGNRWSVDPDLTAAAELEVTPLLTTSSRAWRHDWSGGVLPTDALALPADGVPDPKTARLQEQAPLALLVQGRFPAFVPEDDSLRLPDPAGPRTELVLVGSSLTFENERMRDPELGCAGFLERLVLGLTDRESLALAAREPAAPALAEVEPARRARLRLLAVATPPVLLALASLLWHLARRSRRSYLPAGRAPRRSPWSGAASSLAATRGPLLATGLALVALIALGSRGAGSGSEQPSTLMTDLVSPLSDPVAALELEVPGKPPLLFARTRGAWRALGAFGAPGRGDLLAELIAQLTSARGLVRGGGRAASYGLSAERRSHVRLFGPGVLDREDRHLLADFELGNALPSQRLRSGGRSAPRCFARLGTEEPEAAPIVELTLDPYDLVGWDPEEALPRLIDTRLLAGAVLETPPRFQRIVIERPGADGRTVSRLTIAPTLHDDRWVATDEEGDHAVLPYRIVGYLTYLVRRRARGLGDPRDPEAAGLVPPSARVLLSPWEGGEALVIEVGQQLAESVFAHTRFARTTWQLEAREQRLLAPTLSMFTLAEELNPWEAWLLPETESDR